MKKLLPFIFIFGIVGVFFWQFLFKGLLPIPSDTIVGLYYPFREAYFKTNPNGVPYKNFLITDPVRQQIPWRNLSITALKNNELPLWNPYNFAGTPHLANYQSAFLYPLNLLFFIFPFSFSWSLLIFLQPLLAGIFIYLYLNNSKLKRQASILGAIVFSFSGFSIAWMEWGTILHTALWLPLILLSIDKIFSQNSSLKSSIINHKSLVSKLRWSFVFLLAMVSSFFAGHLQTFFYLSIFSLVYFIARWLQHGKSLRTIVLFLILTSLFLILTLVQWFPTLKFIMLSARNVDLSGFTQLGWFIPWQNLIQFLAPDFFGNPATLNYYGIWNYAEFIGYIGIAPLVMALFAIFFRRDKKSIFFATAFIISLIFALETIFAKLPFQFNLPFISSSQPTRLLFITDFSLSVLAALGLDYFMLHKDKRKILYILTIIGVLFTILWGFIFIFHGNLISFQNLIVAKQNLILPTTLFILVSVILISSLVLFKKYEKNSAIFLTLTCLFLILITVFDLFRFGWKFEPFTNKEYLFPSSQAISYLQNQKQPFRVMSNDSRILPPNFSIMYKIQTLDGYDPLYLQRYGELMVATKRNKPDINPPFGFNRIITPQDYSSKMISLLNVKYVLSLDEINNTNLTQVFTDETVRIYENKLVLPRAFFVTNTVAVNSKKDAIDTMFDRNFLLEKQAVVEVKESNEIFKSNWSIGSVSFVSYGDNKVIIKTSNSNNGFLVLTDSFYPTWHASIDGEETAIYLTDYNFRGIIVPKGEHIVEFYDSLF